MIDFLSVNKWKTQLPIALHLIPLILLNLITFFYIPSSLFPTYVVFSVLFILSTFISLNTLLKYRSGIFYYLLNLMFVLGFWFKFSIQKITGLNYREPIGTFTLNTTSEVKVLWVVIAGMTGFILAQLISFHYFSVEKTTFKNSKKKKQAIIALVFTIGLTTLLSAINLNYNILLFAIKPSLILPLKGNAIYFLLLTRATLFLFFYFCFRTYSLPMIFWGSLIASIASIGVLSRMIIVLYFAAIVITFLQSIDEWTFKTFLKKGIITISIFGFFSFITVLFGTGVREHFMEKFSTQPNTIPTATSSAPSPPPIDDHNLSKKLNLSEKLKTYKELAMGRWIGMEGVMAVESYSQKSFSFLWEALKEKSYHGNSFYTQIAIPELYNKSSSSHVISTSVPGPIAFFYYSGSKFFVFFMIFLSGLFFSFIESKVFKFYASTNTVAVFVSTFIVFDFFQFGISPLAFFRYLLFSLSSVALFYFLIAKKEKYS